MHNCCTHTAGKIAALPAAASGAAAVRPAAVTRTSGEGPAAVLGCKTAKGQGAGAAQGIRGFLNWPHLSHVPSHHDLALHMTT
jgi:hypothetical protein